MSKARGASRTRFLSREGRMNKIDLNTGVVKKRPFNNSKLTKRRENGKIVSKGHHHQPTMTVERNGKLVEVEKTVTQPYRRRVFKDSNGNYPEGAYKLDVKTSGNQQEVWVVNDTKEVKVSSVFCPHISNPQGYKDGLTDPNNL